MENRRSKFALCDDAIFDPQSSILDSRFSILDSRFSILDPRSSILASPDPEPSNTEPRQRLRIIIRIRLLFKARAAEIFGVPHFQIFQISEYYHLARQVRFVAQHRVDQDPSLPVHL